MVEQNTDGGSRGPGEIGGKGAVIVLYVAFQVST